MLKKRTKEPKAKITTNPRSLASPSPFGEGAGGRGKKIPTQLF